MAYLGFRPEPSVSYNKRPVCIVSYVRLPCHEPHCFYAIYVASKKTSVTIVAVKSGSLQIEDRYKLLIS